MYKGDKLRKYIESSVLKKVNDDFHVRMSKDMAVKYDAGVYTNAINSFKKDIHEIKTLNLQYPAKAKPVYYVYLVPDESFVDLLNFPFPDRKSGGRPVSSYDLDGFNTAYGSSQNIWENYLEKPSISSVVNNIHEFAHLVHGMFFTKNRFIAEGFAEALPLYTLDYESKFEEHRKAIKGMKGEQIFSVKELLNRERNNTFHGEAIIPNRSCSFDLSYISSYLFVRSCMEIVASKYNLNRSEATQKFLEIVRSSECTHEFLVWDIAEALDLPREELLNKKTLQLKTLKNL